MKKWIPGAIGAAVVVALAASAWYTGLKAEQAFKEELAKANTGPAFKLEVANYDRGWFRSHGVLKLVMTDAALTDGSTSPTLFEQPFTVVHGPILWDTAFAFRPALFGFKAHLEAQPDWPQDIKNALADERVRLTSRVGFTGSSSTHLRIADGDLQLSTGSLTLQRGDLHVDYDPSDKDMSAEFVWPGLLFKGEMGEVSLEGMGFEWSGTYYSQNVQVGSGSYHIDKIQAKQGEMEAFALNALRLSASQSLDASGEKVSSSVDMTLANVLFLGQEMVKDGSLHLELNNLSMAALKKLDQQNSGEMTPEQMETLLADLMKLFEHGAELKIDPMKAQIQGQPFELKLLAKLPAASTETSDPMALFQQAEADLNINTSAQLLAAWAPEEFAGYAGDSGSLAVQLRGGNVTINGQPYVPGSADEAADEEAYSEDADWSEDDLSVPEETDASI